MPSHTSATSLLSRKKAILNNRLILPSAVRSLKRYKSYYRQLSFLQSWTRKFMNSLLIWHTVYVTVNQVRVRLELYRDFYRSFLYLRRKVLH